VQWPELLLHISISSRHQGGGRNVEDEEHDFLLGLLPRSRAAVTVDADTARPERLPLLDLLREREMRAAPR
jgi:hypothetical protein